MFCPQLVFVHACKALDFGAFTAADANITWQAATPQLLRDALETMREVPGLPSDLAPARFTVVPVREWQLASTSFLPKWKCPG